MFGETRIRGGLFTYGFRIAFALRQVSHNWAIGHGRILALPPEGRLAVDWQSAVSRIGNRLAIRPPAECHSAKSRCIGTSLRYKPASIHIGGSAKIDRKSTR